MKQDGATYEYETDTDSNVSNGNSGMMATIHSNNTTNHDEMCMISQCISDGFMAVEELRQVLLSIQQRPNMTVTMDALEELQHHMNHILHIVTHLHHLVLQQLQRGSHTSNDATTTTTHQMMLDHIRRKAIDITSQTLQFCFSNYVELSTSSSIVAAAVAVDVDIGDDDSEENHIPLEERLRVGQGCMARMTEVCILLSSSFTSTVAVGGSAVTTAAAAAATSVESIDDLVQRYVQFQKRTLRLRCKPHIAQLVQERRDSKEAFDFIMEMIKTNSATAHDNSDASPSATTTHDKHDTASNHQVPVINNIDADDDNDDDAVPVIDLSTFSAKIKQQQLSQQMYQTLHSPVFTIVLGTAATLIHPLLSWMNHLSSELPQEHVNGNSEHQQTQPQLTSHQYLHEMCQLSIQTIHEQAEALVRTLNDWFYEDRKGLMDCCIQLSNNDIKIQTPSVQILVGHVNAMVDEMAYIAQILERYQALISVAVLRREATQPMLTTINEIITEWVWQYSTFERILVLQQWQISITSGSAVPVCIVIGTEIKVSSCIEDAQYISTRTMDRAMSTQSVDAISTVAYTIIHDIWSTDSTTNHHDNHESQSPLSSTSSCAAVYQALMDEIGCWTAEVTADSSSTNDDMKKVGSSPSSGSNAFATALLDALDDDLGSGTNSYTTMKTPVKSKPPSSGGTSFLSALMLSSSKENELYDQRQLDTLYCVLNSIHAASVACHSLANTLDDILYDYTDNDEIDVVHSGNSKVNESTSSETMRNHATTSNDATLTTSSTIPKESYNEQNTIKKKAIAKIQLTRDDVLQYSNEYLQLLLRRIDEAINQWCYNDTHSCLYQLEQFFINESYQIMDGTTFQRMEQDERLTLNLVKPFQQNMLLHQCTTKCDVPVLLWIAERMATRVIDMILKVLWNPSNTGGSSSNSSRNDDSTAKKFTEWGALLLSKQSRMLQQYISTTMILQPSDRAMTTTTTTTTGSDISATKVIQIWERLSYVITVLQLEKPMDWITYYHTNSSTNRSLSTLTPDELSQTLHLRVDFPSDAIEAVVSKLRPYH
jgi:hypothetical protein